MARIRAPELAGRGWVGAPADTTLASLRGRFVLLDFWTFCCVNCLHVLDELRPIEQRWADELVVVGVHSPKFRHEAEPGAVADAVERYGITHPVLDDPDLTTWRAYAAKAWPTLVLVDPEGFIAARYAGEGHAHAIDAVLAELVPQARRSGTLTSDGGLPPAPRPRPDGLLFPSGVLSLGDGRLLVADTAHHQLAVTVTDSDRVLLRVGTGRRGRRDGAAGEAELNEPQGMCRLPDDVAALVGYDVVVADTVNHLLRGIRLADWSVRTVAGTGRMWTSHDRTSLSSPWDVAWWDDRVWVAMAGIHQLWTFDPRSGRTVPVAGTRTEGLRDGPLMQAWFAQPSGLAAHGRRLWVADAETSSLRWVEGEAVHTAVGQGLFDFGFRDGDRESARLQHPLGVAALTDGSVAVADTYNGAVRRFDPSTGQLSTLSTGLREPSSLVATADGLLVCESAAHRLVTVPVDARAVADDHAEQSIRPPTLLAAGPVDLVVVFTPPPGQHLDGRYGPATRLTVSSTPGALLAEGEGTSTDLSRRLTLDPRVGEGVLHVSASAASCDGDGPDGAEPGAACHLHQQDWGIPIVLDASGAGVLRLALGSAAE
jgi:thiol-disulfide isomerase/thioredoxin